MNKKRENEIDNIIKHQEKILDEYKELEKEEKKKERYSTYKEAIELMESQNALLSNVWKILIIFIVICGICILSILINNNLPKYRYETRYIQLENRNFGDILWVTDYICSDGVEITNLQSRLFSQHWFYASTWIDAPIHKGECMIKYKVRVE